MKKLYIAPFDCCVYIYKTDERKRFAKDYNAEVETNNLAQVIGNGVWVGDHKNKIGVCFHEAVHLADWVIEDRLCMKQGTLESNTELRAYLTEYIGNAIVDYCVN